MALEHALAHRPQGGDLPQGEAGFQQGVKRRRGQFREPPQRQRRVAQLAHARAAGNDQEPAARGRSVEHVGPAQQGRPRALAAVLDA